MTGTDDRPRVYLQTRVRAGFVERLDRWREAYPGPPSRAAAMRWLMAEALDRWEATGEWPARPSE